MTTHETSIDVDVPVRTAYDQWTQFESFPEFMNGVDKIVQIDATHTHWSISIAGIKRDFDAEITEQTPDQRIAWKSTSGSSHAGVITFHRLDASKTRLMLQLDTEPEGLIEKAGEAVGVVDRQAKSDLERFKTFIEAKGAADGSWRGEVSQDPTA